MVSSSSQTWTTRSVFVEFVVAAGAGVGVVVVVVVFGRGGVGSGVGGGGAEGLLKKVNRERGVRGGGLEGFGGFCEEGDEADVGKRTGGTGGGGGSGWDEVAMRYVCEVVVLFVAWEVWVVVVLCDPEFDRPAVLLLLLLLLLLPREELPPTPPVGPEIMIGAEIAALGVESIGFKYLLCAI
jgi:hypothetical protein